MGSIGTASANLTPQFNDLLRKHKAPPCRENLSIDAVEGFLKEAYRIVWLCNTHCDGSLFLTNSFIECTYHNIA